MTLVPSEASRLSFWLPVPAKFHFSHHGERTSEFVSWVTATMTRCRPCVFHKQREPSHLAYKTLNPVFDRADTSRRRFNKSAGES